MRVTDGAPSPHSFVDWKDKIGGLVFHVELLYTLSRQFVQS